MEMSSEEGYFTDPYFEINYTNLLGCDRNLSPWTFVKQRISNIANLELISNDGVYINRKLQIIMNSLS